MRRSEDRILITHTGSLPRPANLTALYVDRQRGNKVDPAQIKAAGREAVRAIVPRQAEAGIDVGNDGEQTRAGFFLYLMERLSGLGLGTWERRPRGDVERYPEFKARRNAEVSAKPAVSAREALLVAVSEVTYVGVDAVREECALFAEALKESGNPFAEAFMTAPSPGIIATALGNKHYDSMDAYLAALGKALRTEYEAIVDAGFVLQLDCPDLGLERHVTFHEKPLGEFLGFAESVVAVINTALENIPRDRVRLHVCWGNYEGPHDCDVPLQDILPVLLKADVGALVLPFANGRHAYVYKLLGTHRLADDQIIVAGVIDTLGNVIEHPETIAERLENVARMVGDPKRVMAGTDCGFDTNAGSGRVAEDVVWAKLAALRDGARLASERLFG
jgi:5-methyltetrahydropteroyltriglutamate--homocysteine methyltransferase